MNLEKERKYRSPQLRLMVAVVSLFNLLLLNVRPEFTIVPLCVRYAHPLVEGTMRYSRKECLACSAIETNLT